MKKIFILLVIFLVLTPTIILAGAPVVGCGTSGDVDQRCKFTDLAGMPVVVINWIKLYLIIPLTILLITIGGLVLLFSGGSPNLRALGINIIKTTLIGGFLAYGAVLIVNAILTALGGATI